MIDQRPLKFMSQRETGISQRRYLILEFMVIETIMLAAVEDANMSLSSQLYSCIHTAGQLEATNLYYTALGKPHHIPSISCGAYERTSLL